MPTSPRTTTALTPREQAMVYAANHLFKINRMPTELRFDLWMSCEHESNREHARSLGLDPDVLLESGGVKIDESDHAQIKKLADDMRARHHRYMKGVVTEQELHERLIGEMVDKRRIKQQEDKPARVHLEDMALA